MLNEIDANYALKPQFGFYSNIKKQDWILKINCTKCKRVENSNESHYQNNPICLECILEIISDNSNKKVRKIELDNNHLVPLEDINTIKSLTLFFTNYKITLNSLCEISDCVFSNPIHFSEYLRQWALILHIKKSSICGQCLKRFKELKRSFQKTNFFHILLKIPPEENWLEMLLIGPYSKRFRNNLTKSSPRKEMINSYSITNHPLYTITIYTNTQFENYLEITTNFGTKSNEFYSTLLQTLQKKLIPPSFDQLLPIGIVIQKYTQSTMNFLKINYNNLDSEEISKIALFFSISKLNMGKLFPLLVDNRVDEIYLDNPYRTIYLDHRDYGRCDTSLSLTESDIASIKTFLRISSNRKLDSIHPTLKTSIQNQYFFCRFAVDIDPVVPAGFSLDIRKMNRQIFTVPELVKRGMMSNQIAAFLYVCILNRLNITTIGETNTGKTTLINAFDLLTPSHYRKIYIEEAPESLDQNAYSNHQLKYLVEPGSKDSSKTQEMYKLLHRNPDIIYLGEILTREEAHALFHCLSAGLRGFQTIHARDIRSIINRWQFHFKIDPACFNDLDIIVLLKRTETQRYIAMIAEISYKVKKLEIHPIFKFNPNSFTWEGNLNLRKLLCFSRLTLSNESYEYLKNAFDFYSQVFSKLSKQDDWNVGGQVSYFQYQYNQIENCRKKMERVPWDDYLSSVRLN